MTTTRSAAKKQEKQSSEAHPAEEAEPGSKHKTEPEEHAKQPSPKRTKKEEEEEEEEEENEGEEGDEGEGKCQEVREKDGGSTTSSTAVRPQAHDDNTPSSILEKGVIYFFFRGRVNIDDPSSVADIARTYIVLRPIDREADLKGGGGGGGGGDQSDEKEEEK